MGSIFMDKVGNVFIAKSDRNTGGASADITGIDRVGQNFLAYGDGGPGLPNYFIHYSDYVNDEIGITKTSGDTGDVITTYSYPNSNYVDTESIPLPVPIASGGIANFFVNGNLFISRSPSADNWTITKYSWPDLAVEATLNLTSDSGSLKIAVSDTKIFVSFRDAAFGAYRVERYDDDLVLEVAAVSIGVGDVPAIAADSGFFYYARFQQWIPPFPSFWKMFRMTTSFGSNTELFSYNFHHTGRTMAANNSLIYVPLTDFSWKIYNHSGTTVGTLPASDHRTSLMSNIAITTNYVATIDVGGASVNIYNNSAPFALVRTLS